MAKCPNCGRKLRLFDWKPECPGCGVNLNYFGANEKLLADSEKVEIEHAKSQPRLDRAKAATIGSKIGIIRMVLFLIPIASLFLPIYKITVNGNVQSYNAISIYNLVSSVDIGTVIGNLTPLILSIIFVALAAVLCIVFTVLQLTAGTKRGLRKNIILSSISVALCIASILSFTLFNKNATNQYFSFVLQEADYAISSGNQTNSDEAFDKLNTKNEFALDTLRLENAIKAAKTAISASDNFGYTADELDAINTAIDNGENLLASDEITTSAIRNAVNDLNSSVYTYGTFTSVINLTDDDALKHDDDVYSDECLVTLYEATENAKIVLQNTIDRAEAIENNGVYSDKTYNKIAEETEKAQNYLDTLANGEMIVELMDDDGSGEKTEKEIALETAKLLRDCIDNINSKICGLNDISCLVPLAETVKAQLDDDTIDCTVTGSIGIGVLLILLLYAIQLVFNIIIFKKGFEVKYTTCLIGGIPSDTYFEYVKSGMSREQLDREMLKALAKLNDEGKEDVDDA